MIPPSLRRDDYPAMPRVARIAGAARRTVPDLTGTDLTSTVLVPVRALAFWAAIVLPVANVALVLGGISTPAETVAFLGLLAANLLALLVGHSYRQ